MTDEKKDVDLRYWFGFLRDSPTELFEVTLKNGFNKFVEKYGSLPDTATCSIYDKKEEFFYENILVKPKKNMLPGMIFMTSKDGLKINVNETINKKSI